MKTQILSPKSQIREGGERTDDRCKFGKRDTVNGERGFLDAGGADDTDYTGVSDFLFVDFVETPCTASLHSGNRFRLNVIRSTFPVSRSTFHVFRFPPPLACALALREGA